MQRRTEKIKSILTLLLLLLCTLVAGYLTVLSLCHTGRNTYLLEKVYLTPEPPWKKLLTAVLFCALWVPLGHLAKTISGRGMARIRTVSLVIFALAIAGWILWVDMPLIPDDTGICWSAAGIWRSGEYASLMAPGAYLEIYPHQWGLVLMESLFQAFSPEYGYRAFYWINGVLVLLAIHSGLALTERFGGKNKNSAQILWLFFAAANFPSLLYINYLYGEIAACSAVLVLWDLMEKYLEQGKKRTLLAAGFLGSFCFVLRKNLLIFLIAICCILLLHILGQGKSILKRGLIYLLLMGICAFLPLGLVQGYASLRSSLPGSSGIPSSLYIAMGMQDTWNGPGWYNNYNAGTYRLYEEDAAAASAAGWEEVSHRLQEMRETPGGLSDFYKRKLLTQWAEPSYDTVYCLMQLPSGADSADATNTALAKGLPYAALREGRISELIWSFLNAYQALIYLGSFLYLAGGLLQVIADLRDRSAAPLQVTKHLQVTKYLPAVTLLGGFLFSLLWEAKSRYVLPYFVCMILMAALGYAKTAEWIYGFLRKKKDADM